MEDIELNDDNQYIFTPLKCSADPEATAPHTVLSFAPVIVCHWLSEGARLKLSFSCEGRGTPGSSQYSPPHSGSHLEVNWCQVFRANDKPDIKIKVFEYIGFLIFLNWNETSDYELNQYCKSVHHFSLFAAVCACEAAITHTQELCLQRPCPAHISGQPSPMYRLSRAQVCCLSNGACCNQRNLVAGDLNSKH